MKVLSWYTFAFVSLVAYSSTAFAAEDAKGLEFFENKIRPVLVQHCYECHSAKSAKIKGGLLLDTKEGLLKGGDKGPSVIPGKPAQSLLIKSLKHDGLKMPPKAPLSAEIISDFEKWVAMGAPDPRTGGTGYKRLTLEESKTFWAFQPVKEPTAPKVANKTWGKNKIDQFILAKLEEKKLSPVADADRATLIRRVYFDLIGLPPTPEEVEAFLKDTDANAFEKVVDKLLASKHFGERWGRYWLDIARYAESNGNADNISFPEAWRYRDYVIDATNKDVPYDVFIREQIAGDLMKAEGKEKDRLLIATGLLALTSKPRAQNNPDYKFDLIADQIDVTTRSVLGLSVMCARCHDHKFDPISTKEYYGLAGIFDSSVMLFGGNAGKGGGKNNPVGGFHDLSDGKNAMGLKEGTGKDCKICIGGESNKLGATVSRSADLAAVSQGKSSPKIESGSGRMILANYLTSKENPLTARVAVNRIWMHLFGQGIVKSADNFGFLGDRPTHPELLDQLAYQFMKDDWSTKKMIRTLVLSRVYQLSSENNTLAYKTDPDNLLRWRMSMRRLDAEAQRDAMLFVSGKLKAEPLVGTLIEGGGGKKNPALSKESTYRSIYLGIVRGRPLPDSLSEFDVANPNIVVAQREETTVPAQALYLMNSPFVLDQAKATAAKFLDKKSLNDTERIDQMYRTMFARPATSAEVERAKKYLAATTKELGGKTADAWTSFAQVLLASVEFRYVR